MLSVLTSNHIFNVCAVSWFAAQVIKTILDFLLNKSFSAERLTGAGGMPSSHSAFVTALAFETIQTCGFRATESALAMAFAIVVMYDRMGVRRRAGDQAKLINNLMDELQNNGYIVDFVYKNLKEFLGHSPLQVAAGFLLGLIIAMIM